MNMDLLATTETDESLVAKSLAGNREAFGGIVRRYQSLICSLAYSATGSLSASEDLAQETFITAWRQLSALREPGKLRPWLCRIAHNLTSDTLKKEGRSPLRASEPLDAAEAAAAHELSPPDQAMTREEEAILWRALADIPELYREPLVLFYREQQSVARVAEALELSEDAVKQRLARGRRLLQERVEAFVEGALRKSAPGPAFAQGVLLALPGISASTASSLGTIFGKGAALGVIKSIAAGLVVVFGNYAGYRMSLAMARSDVERTFIKRFYGILLIAVVIFSAVLWALILMGQTGVNAHPVMFYSLVMVVIVGMLAVFGGMAIWSMRVRSKIIAARPACPAQPAWEYRSGATFLGMPLVHIRIGGHENCVVKAWISAGSCAVGGLFAFGGMAIAPISIGGCAIGLAPWGGMAVGLIPIGGFAIGGWALGGLALGWESYGGMAIAWKAASGGIALAHNLAAGSLAYAGIVGKAAAAACRSSLFFRFGELFARYSVLLNLLWVLPLIAWWRIALKSRRVQS